MIFASPLWLIGLLPWVGVALYLLWGRRKRQNVPFLELWRGPTAVEHARWKVSAPPVALAMGLLAMAAAILGAAGPGMPRTTANDSSAVKVVVDRGLTMSARGATDLRFREAGREASVEISRGFGRGVAIDTWVVPAREPGTTDAIDPERFADPQAWSRWLDRLPPTAVDSAQSIREIVRRALAAGPGPVVVVSDAAIGVEDPRIVQVAPQARLRNVGIALFSARTLPRPQVMVRVRNDSPLKTAALEINFGDTGEAPVRRTIDLPPAPGEHDFFLNAKHLGPALSATLSVPDDLDADNTAWLVGESNWPRVELSRPMGELSRLVGIYARLHPPSVGSRVVRVVNRTDSLGIGESGIVVVSGTGIQRVRPTRVVPDPITEAVRDWAAIELPDAGARPPDGWNAVLFAGDHPLVATHEGPGGSRQVWVGVSSDGWADRPEYVAFWAATIDWADSAGGRGDQYVSYPLDRFDPSWKPAAGTEKTHDPGTWPGLYTRADGVSRAFNALPPSLPPPAPTNEYWRQRLAGLRSTGPGYLDLSGMAMVAATAFICLAAVTWRKASGGNRPRAAGPAS
jgi:hypothetical protein